MTEQVRSALAWVFQSSNIRASLRAREERQAHTIKEDITVLSLSPLDIKVLSA